MPHLPHRTMVQQSPKPTMAEVQLPIQSAEGITRHLGTTRQHRPRALKPPIT